MFLLCMAHFFTFLELNDAVKRQNMTEVANVCIMAKGNLSFLTALNFVVENELNEMYDILMKYEARFNIQNEHGGEMLLAAVRKVSVQLCGKLFRDGITKNTRDCPNPSVCFKMAIIAIFQDKLTEIYDLLIKYFGNLKSLIDKVDKLLLHDMIYRRNYVLCEKLIKDGIDITTKDREGNSPLHIAAEVDDACIIDLLIKNKADIKAKNNARQTALRLAAENGCRDAFCTLRLHDHDDSSADRIYVENLPWYS